MKKLMCGLFAVIVLTCCNNNDESIKDKAKKTGSTRKTAPSKQQEKKGPFKLDLFPAPAIIDGCSETFTYDTCKPDNYKYVFVSDYGDNHFIKVKGKQIRLVKDSNPSKDLNSKNYNSVYHGGGYKVILKLKIVEQYEEAAMYKGTIQISGNKTNATFKIHGVGGC
jgi:hypothetical protein